MALDFSKIGPWNKIKEVEVDGQKMVRIPKFYHGRITAPAGSQHEGKTLFVVSDIPREGLHVHPAFMWKGEELPYFEYGAYEASNADDPNGTMYDSTGYSKILTGHKACSLPNVHVWNRIYKEEAVTACEARNTGASGSEQYGWHLHNIYETSAIAILMLAEYGATNMQDIIGRGNVDQTWDTSTNFGGLGADKSVLTGASDAVYRGIHELWGNCWEHTDGAYTDTAGVLYILSNKMDGTYVTTSYKGGSGGTATNSSTSGVAARHDGFMVELSNATGTNYDLTDVFAPSVLGKEATEATFHDTSWYVPKNFYGTNERTTTNTERYRPQTNVYTHGSFPGGSVVGPFLWGVSHGRADAFDGFRLARRPV